jgi:hypothetical protein
VVTIRWSANRIATDGIFRHLLRLFFRHIQHD